MTSRSGGAPRRLAVRALAVAFACACACACAVPSYALAQAATVDQVLAALAEVVKDRAKQVATRTIADNLKRSLCEGTVTLPPYRPPEAGTPATRTSSTSAEATRSDLPFAPEQPTSTTQLTLYLGGKEPCRSSYWKATPRPSATDPAYPACDADDVFLRTCRLANRLDVPLTDSYLLKSLSRDTIDLLMRIGGRNLSAKVYTESGLVEVGAFIHAVLEQLGAKKPSPRELADPTLALADRLSAGLPGRSFADLDPADVSTTSAKLLAADLAENVVTAWARAGCPPYDTATKPAGAPARCDPAWYIAPSCDAFARAKESRDKVFKTLFSRGGLLYAGRDAPCGEAFAADPTRRRQCRQARLTINLYGYLVRGGCTPGRTDEQVRSTFRELGYVVAEHGAYEDALNELSPATVGKLDAFLDDVHALDLSYLPREELAAGIRVVGRYAAAVDLAPEATAAWLRLLAQDLQSSAQPPYDTSYPRLLHGAALGTDTLGAVPGPVAALRVAVKDLLTLPALAVLRHSDLLDGASSARKKLAAPLESANASMRKLLDAIQRDPASTGAFRDYVGALAAFLSDLADVTVAMGEAVDVAASHSPALAATRSTTSAMDPVARKAVFERAAMAMKQGSLAMQLAADRDWVGLAIRVSDEVSRVPGATGKLPELERSLRFVRILLSMYQATTVDEAKAIFAANLEDASSRERRYQEPPWTVDVTALVGVNGGHQYSRVEANGETTSSDTELYGVLAPFGVQVANGRFGILLYPLDLGAYLTSPSSDEGTSPKWPDALRAGAAAYWRIDKGIPVIVGGGADYRPRFGGREEFRWYVTAGLELPLYLIH
jgi:hypothetical protein